MRCAVLFRWLRIPAMVITRSDVNVISDSGCTEMVIT